MNHRTTYITSLVSLTLLFYFLFQLIKYKYFIHIHAMDTSKSNRASEWKKSKNDWIHSKRVLLSSTAAIYIKDSLQSFILKGKKRSATWKNSKHRPACGSMEFPGASTLSKCIEKSKLNLSKREPSDATDPLYLPFTRSETLSTDTKSISTLLFIFFTLFLSLTSTFSLLLTHSHHACLAMLCCINSKKQHLKKNDYHFIFSCSSKQ